MEYLKENRGFIKEKDGEIQISTAAILLFGKNPQNFFPRARIRFIRYEGTEEKFGTEMNVIKDVIFEGTLLKLINEAIAYLDTQVKEKTYLGPDEHLLQMRNILSLSHRIDCKCCYSSCL